MSAPIAALLVACCVASLGAGIEQVLAASARRRTSPGTLDRADRRAAGAHVDHPTTTGSHRHAQPPATPRSPAARLATAAGVIGTLAVVAALDTGMAALVGAGALAFRATRGWRTRRRQGSERARAAAALPDSVDVLISCLQAGQTPVLALGELSRRAPPAARGAWQAAAERLHRGDGFADAITELARHCGASAVPVVAVLAGGVRDGLPLLPLLDRLTVEADARRRRSAEAEARKLPVRLSFPLVCCTLPAFVLLAIVPALLGALSGLQLPT